MPRRRKPPLDDLQEIARTLVERLGPVKALRVAEAIRDRAEAGRPAKQGEKPPPPPSD